MNINRTFFLPVLLFSILMTGCNQITPNSVELITNPERQNAIFNQLMMLVGNSLQATSQNDSMAFLILPVEASCPACRKKTIDSIINHQNILSVNHFVIVTASAGRKTMNSYFREQNASIPNVPQVILDTIDRAKKLELFENNPAFYYTIHRKVYKKVLAWPATIKLDLQEFFSGKRTNTDVIKNDK